ncbi:MAG: porin family protein [Bacteroidota bacterium]
MKKSIITLAIITFTMLYNVNAQERQFGVKGGLNLASLSVEDADDSNLLTSFHAGLYANLPVVADFVALQPELLYSGKGIRVEYTNLVTGESEYQLNYIDIPIYLIYNLQTDFYFQAGPYVGILMNAQSETDAEILSFLDLDTEDEIDKDYFNDIDFGLSAGMGFRVSQLDVGFNYSFGLLPVADEDDSLEPLIGDAKNRVIQVYVGFRF